MYDQLTTPGPDRVLIRVPSGTLESAIRCTWNAPSRMSVGRPVSLTVGPTVVWSLMRFDELPATAALHCLAAERGEPLITLRRAQRLPDPLHVASQAVRPRLTRAAYLELLLIERLESSEPTLWGRYWGVSDRKPPEIVFRSVPDCGTRTLAEPMTNGQTSHRPVPLPRTNLMLGDPTRVNAWRSIHVAIIGVGRSGSIAADCLVAQGVRRLTLVDPDVVEPGSLDGMTLVGLAAVGRPKVETVGEALAARLPALIVTCMADAFPTARSIRGVATADVLVTTVDEDRPRLAANLLSRRLNQLHLDIGTAGNARGGPAGADIRLFLPQSRCLLCMGGVANPTTVVGHQPRRPGNSSRLINASAVHLAVQMLMDAVGGWAGSSHWIRLQAGRRPVSLQTQRMNQPRSSIRCPWCGSEPAS